MKILFSVFIVQYQSLKMENSILFKYLWKQFKVEERSRKLGIKNEQ